MAGYQLTGTMARYPVADTIAGYQLTDAMAGYPVAGTMAGYQLAAPWPDIN